MFSEILSILSYLLIVIVCLGVLFTAYMAYFIYAPTFKLRRHLSKYKNVMSKRAPGIDGLLFGIRNEFAFKLKNGYHMVYPEVDAILEDPEVDFYHYDFGKLNYLSIVSDKGY
jgi:hypothetical protein